MKEKTIENCRVLIGCFIIEIFLSSFPKIPSIFFVECISYFNVDREQASFPFTLSFLVTSFAGPLVGYMEQIFGMKPVILGGCIVSTLSVFALFFAKEIVTLTVFWGVIIGFSLGFGSIMIPSLLNQHFPESKSTSNGLALSGACLGGLALPPILRACINFYGLPGAFLVLSALTANTIPASLLLHNPKTASKAVYSDQNDAIKNKDIAFDTDVIYCKDVDERGFIESSFLEQPRESPNCIKELFNVNENGLRNSNDLKLKFGTESSNPRAKRRTFAEKLPSKENIFTFSKLTIFICPIYITLLIIHGGAALVTTTTYTVIIDALRDKAVGEKMEVYYLMILSIFDLVSRFASGFFIDKEYFSYPLMFFIVCFCEALSLIAFVLVENYILIMICIIMIAFVFGCLRLLEISLIHEFMECDKRNMAMTSRYCVYAPLSLAISPMIGYFREKKGSYDSIFYILSAITLICGCLACFIPLIAKWKQTLKKENLISSSNEHNLQGKNFSEKLP